MTLTSPLADHVATDRQSSCVGEGPNIDTGHTASARQTLHAGVEQYIRDDQIPNARQAHVVVAEQSPHPTKCAASTIGELSGGAPSSPAPASELPPTKGDAPVLADPSLAMAADFLDDIERIRTATENRLRQLTRPLGAVDDDGGQRGFGYTADHPDVARLAAHVRAMLCDSTVVVDLIGARPKLARGAPCCMEHDAVKQLQAQMRRHPLGPWVAQQAGVGTKQAARLLAAVRDPYWNDLHGRPRTQCELRSYCGWGDARAQVRRRGVKANWSDTAKKRTWLVIESCIKTLRAPCAKPDGAEYAEHVDGCRCSKYRVVYDAARLKCADAVHDDECVRCGPRGAPAPYGSPLSLAHKKARAERVAAKELLNDLWTEARRLHGESEP